jgi:nicotine blue oxidoreductase
MIAGLLLAAGGGRRYGMPKALAERGGRLWVDLALDVLRDAACEPVVVVLGAAAAEVRARAALTGAVPVDNPGWPEGIGSSLRAGLAALAATPAEATVVMLVDTPGITAEAVRRIVAGAAGSAEAALVVATYAGQDGHPVLLGRQHWAGVGASAVGDRGARPYLRANADRVRRIPCDDVADGTDIDRPYPPDR